MGRGRVLPLFLSQKELIGLKAYKYKAGGYTILDDLHNPVWNVLVNLLPMWLAPNCITLMATASIVAAYILNVLYLPDFTGQAPGWVYVFTGASVVAYVNLDCMDGKQARRTGSSSPLGQLFDHGCDALVLHMMLGNIAASLGVPCSWRMAAGCMGVMVPWILAQWEEYFTGVMMYGTRLYGVLEANYSICAVHLLTYALGPAVWATRLPVPAAAQPLLGPSISLANLSLAFVSLAGLAQAYHNIHRVLLAPEAVLPEEERGEKRLGRGEAARQLLSFAAVLSLGALLLHQAEGRGALHGRLAFAVFGVSYALAATQLIIAHMCKQPLGAPWLVVGMMLCGVAGGAGPASTPGMFGLPGHTAALALVAVGLLAFYSVYVLSVIDQICGSLGIKAFTITPKSPVSTEHKQQPKVSPPSSTSSGGDSEASAKIPSSNVAQRQLGSAAAAVAKVR